MIVVDFMFDSYDYEGKGGYFLIDNNKIIYKDILDENMKNIILKTVAIK